MRRLVLVLAALALLVPASAGAESKKPYPRVIVKSGSVQLKGGKLVGSVLMINDGRKRSGRADVELGIATGKSENGMEASALVQRLHVKPLKVKEKQRISFSRPVPPSVAPGKRTVSACVDGGTCKPLGKVTIPGTVPSPAPAPSAPSSPPAPTPLPLEDDVPPISTVPTAPIPFEKENAFEVTSGSVPYWAYVPSTYDGTNQIPTTLLIWLHGCYGYSEGDIWNVAPEPPQNYLAIAVGGREGDCWTPSVDEAKVLAALADVETHFNIDRRRVILGGYSSGGDLSYRTGFRHSSTFAGLLIENSSPFRDTESTPAESLGAATTKLHIVHLAHTEDETYGIAGVRKEVNEVQAAGFPIELIERPGTHYDEGATESDVRKYLLPHIADGWLA